MSPEERERIEWIKGAPHLQYPTFVVRELTWLLDLVERQEAAIARLTPPEHLPHVEAVSP